MNTFQEAMQKAGIEPPGEIIPDGKLHRFHVEGDKRGSKNGWYIFHDDDPAAGAFGCWKRGISETLCGKEYKHLSAEEKERHRANMESIRKQQEEERARVHTECRKASKKLWDKGTDVDANHAYIVKKSIKPIGIKQSEDKQLLIPVQDFEKAFHGQQFIKPDGTKRFETGTNKAGHFFQIGESKDNMAIICEGYATGASIHEATGHDVVIAFDAGNLSPVAKGFRAKFPDLKIIIAADDDQWTEGNPGLTKATKAARETGALLATPVFWLRETRPTDFNDLHQLEGLDAVRRCIKAAAEPTNDVDDKLIPLNNHIGRSGKSAEKRTVILSKFYPRPFTEQILEEHSFLWEGKRGELWRYNKERALWKPDGDAFIESYFREATATLDDVWKKRNVIAEIVADVAGCSYKETGLPEPAIDLIPVENGVYDLKTDIFRERRPEDYFTWALPWRYNPEVQSTFLRDLIDSMIPSPETLYELAAYSLWRGYPYQKFWLLVGPGSNGKGVFLNIFARLIGRENISNVSLKDIQNSNFAAGTLHRKLANLSGEVDYADLNNTSLLKQLTGGDCIQADRKYLSPVRFMNHAKLIFATNQIPITRDSTDAFYRRAFLVEFPHIFKADPTLDVKIREESASMTAEFEGLMYETLQRLRQLIKQSYIFTYDEDTSTVRARYEALSNPLKHFLSENCEQTWSSSDHVYKFEFRERLNSWLLEKRFNTYTDERIKREMISLGHESGQRGEKRYHAWTGIRWVNSQPSQSSQGFLNRSLTPKKQFKKGCEVCEPCESVESLPEVIHVLGVSE